MKYIYNWLKNGYNTWCIMDESHEQIRSCFDT